MVGLELLATPMTNMNIYLYFYLKIVTAKLGSIVRGEVFEQEGGSLLRGTTVYLWRDVPSVHRVYIGGLY